MDDRYPGSAESLPPYLGGAANPPGAMSERMQSLLSRAVEDQMAEQRQLQTLINDVRQSLAQLQDDVRQTAGAHTVDLLRGEVTGVVAEVRSSSTLVAERLEAIGGALQGTAAAVQGLSARLDRIAEQVDGQQQQLSAVAAAVVQQQQFLAALPDSLAQRLAPAGGATEGRDEVTAQLDAVRDTVAREVAGLRDEVGGVRDEVGGVRDQFGAELADAVRRLGDHVDEAVLALADALLRRRVAPGAADGAVSGAGGAISGAGGATAGPTAEPTGGTPTTASEPMPAPGPQPMPAPQPGPGPEPMPQPGPEPTPGPLPDPEPVPLPEPTPSPTPVPGPGPVPGPPTPAITTGPGQASGGAVVFGSGWSGSTDVDAEIDEFRMPEWTVDDGSGEPDADQSADGRPANWGWESRRPDDAAEPGESGETDERDHAGEKRRPWWRPGG